VLGFRKDVILRSREKLAVRTKVALILRRILAAESTDLPKSGAEAVLEVRQGTGDEGEGGERDRGWSAIEFPGRPEATA
jgi:hypothetical protein